MQPAITPHLLRTTRHQTAYLQCGPADGRLVILVHGWPERAISWRHQLTYLGARGFLAVAPDMRGYGESSQYREHSDYAIEHLVADMRELLGSLGRKSAIWIGHDWGSPVVWALASHHPDQCRAIANLCVPYQPGGFTLESLLPLVNRDIYPAEQFPAGQWEYFLFYRENFERAHRVFEADVRNTVCALFRSGTPGSVLKPARTAFTRIDRGWFGGADSAPAVAIDPAVLDEAVLAVYVEGLRRNGFFGPDSSYMNDEPNRNYARRARNSARLVTPALFVHARYDTVCETIVSRLAEPMRAHCENLSEAIVDSGHWMAQEKPDALNAILGPWIDGLDH